MYNQHNSLPTIGNFNQLLHVHISLVFFLCLFIQFQIVGQIKCNLARVLSALQDREAHLLLNNIIEQVIYELFAFLFTIEDNISV